MFIDLDGFKVINDTHGHQAGDTILTTVAARLREILRETDTIARLGGDEFFIIANEIGSEGEQLALADKINRSISHPIPDQDNGEVYVISASIGLLAFPVDTTTPEAIIEGADKAMYVAKLAGKNQHHLLKSPDPGEAVA
jgi:diguanylate cyclase (GGDEF)-like protein